MQKRNKNFLIFLLISVFIIALTSVDMLQFIKKTKSFDQLT